MSRLPKGPKGWELLTVALAREHFLKNGSAPIYGKTFQDGLFYDDDEEDDKEAAELFECDTELRLYGHLIEQNPYGWRKKIHLDWLLDKTKTGPYPAEFVPGTENQVVYHLFGVQTDTHRVDYFEHIHIYQNPPNVIGNRNGVYFWVPTAAKVNG